MSHKHLTFEDRVVIKKLYSLGYNFNKIAQEIGFNKSTISRELRRNFTIWYHPFQAHNLYLQRKKDSCKRKIDKYSELKKEIIERLKKRHSPEQIAGRIKIDFPESSFMRISHEAIYQWIYSLAAKGDESYKQLRRTVKKRQRRINKKASRLRIPDRKSIHKRPSEIEARNTFGHWEGDTIIGKGHSGCIATMVERNTLFLAAGAMPDKRPSSLNRATLESFGNISNDNIKTITLDNGTEFCDYKDLEVALECEIFFADPYSSWQRGTNENTNGLLREFFPKNLSFENITQNDIDIAVYSLNNRPRKKLNYLTPSEAISKISVAFQH